MCLIETSSRDHPNKPVYVQCRHSVVSDSLRPHEPQHARPPCPSPTPRVHPNSCPLSRWCHPTISSSVVPFSSCPQSLPASGSFPVSQLFAPGGQSIGVPASASVLPMNIQDWFPLGWTGWTSLKSKDSQESFPTPQFKSIIYFSDEEKDKHGGQVNCISSLSWQMSVPGFKPR